MDGVNVDRLKDLAPLPLLRQLLQYGVLAGGSATYVACDWVPLYSVTDLDIFVLDANGDKIRLILDILATYSLGTPRYFAMKSNVLSVHIRGMFPIQVIKSAASQPLDLIYGFDMDYVQTAISYTDDGGFRMVKSEMASWAHDTKTIKYIMYERHHPVRLQARLGKALKKGFSIHKDFKTLEDLCVKYCDTKHISGKSKPSQLFIPRPSKYHKRDIDNTVFYDSCADTPDEYALFGKKVSEAKAREAIDCIGVFDRVQYEADVDDDGNRDAIRYVIGSYQFVRVDNPEMAKMSAEAIRRGMKSQEGGSQYYIEVPKVHTKYDPTSRRKLDHDVKDHIEERAIPPPMLQPIMSCVLESFNTMSLQQSKDDTELKSTMRKECLSLFQFCLYEDAVKKAMNMVCELDNWYAGTALRCKMDFTDFTEALTQDDQKRIAERLINTWLS
jgi:hypothetical protein